MAHPTERSSIDWPGRKPSHDWNRSLPAASLFFPPPRTLGPALSASSNVHARFPLFHHPRPAPVRPWRTYSTLRGITRGWIKGKGLNEGKRFHWFVKFAFNDAVEMNDSSEFYFPPFHLEVFFPMRDLIIGSKIIREMYNFVISRGWRWLFIWLLKHCCRRTRRYGPRRDTTCIGIGMYYLKLAKRVIKTIQRFGIRLCI